MKKIAHFYSLSPQWQQGFAEEMGAEIIDNKIIIIPEILGTGYIYFTEVTRGISILFKDYTLRSPIRLNKLISKEEFYILHYNPSEVHVANYEKDNIINSDFSIFNNQVENLYEPTVNERIFGFILFIDKKIMQEFVGKMLNHGSINKKLNNSDGCYYSCIDSNSLMLILSLKKKSIFNASFDYYLKGISYKLLANFLSSNIDFTSLKDGFYNDFNSNF
ncbi:hypothetical protein OIU80_04680 [Flavobacterium sp. LS1R47]|uniref:Uncharacterized protein n=1 Tax=Flavobacterium frigoritolerans TaxID=2987686 RepID=A0A9X2ZKU0_9FLAO|nr:hypothetical protein [Flavobacterium frigoritolerans]MCV9931567.1 hypothetical protein [Flavobacterium frigoritolerans]